VTVWLIWKSAVKHESKCIHEIDHSRVLVWLRHKSMTFPQTQSINSDQQYKNARALRKLRDIREPIRFLTPIALTGFLIVPVSLLTAVLGF
jgi:hypothetical protein